MSSEPLIDVIPIMRRLQDGQIITQFDYPSCESLGLVKMDFLGLRNLTILDDAIANIKVNRDEDIDLDALSKDMTDPATYELLGRGDTLGVFQLDGGGMRALLRLMQPDNFEDISAALALYRPGPMGVNAHTNFALRKNGKQELIPLDPQLKGKLQPEMVDGSRPHPRHDLRLGDLPGAGHGDRAEARRLHAGQRRPAAPRHGQEEEGGARRRVRPLLARA